MKAVVISCFNNYDIRLQYVESVLSEAGYSVTVVCSDFDHASKRNYDIERENAVQIHVKPYRKNLSIARVRSHLQFSKRVYDKLCELKPDLIYSVIPPNSLVKQLARYKKRNDNVRLIFDIFDLWPESMPTSRTVKKMLFSWKNLRDRHLYRADKILIECDLYRKYLPENAEYTTAYLCKQKRAVDYKHDGDTLNFVYLGSINSLIDIDGIISFLSAVKAKRNVCLFIIGKGANTEAFKNALSLADIPYTDCGAVYDEEEKDRIIARCHFGINMYKKNLCIGLTMKSLEYFSRGLPVINANIYDTAMIVNECSCGFDVTDGAVRAVEYLCGMDEAQWSSLSVNCSSAHDKYFLPETFCKTVKEEID